MPLAQPGAWYHRSARNGKAVQTYRSTLDLWVAPGSTRKGDLSVAYDAAGNVSDLIVRRDGSCLPTSARGPRLSDPAR
jgi:hypothetical protein